MQFSADTAMHPHSDRRSPNVHPEITVHLFVENGSAKLRLACFPSPLSLDVPYQDPPKSCVMHGYTQRKSLQSVIQRRVSILSAFSRDNFEESAADTQLLLGQLEKVNPPFVVRKVCRSGRRNTLLCTADSNSSKRKKK